LGPGIINRRKRAVVPILLQRDSLLATLTKLYDAIGYRPVEKPKTTLADIIAGKTARDSKPQPTSGPSSIPIARPEPSTREIPPSEEVRTNNDRNPDTWASEVIE
jgi:hypothetical protein